MFYWKYQDTCHVLWRFSRAIHCHPQALQALLAALGVPASSSSSDNSILSHLSEALGAALGVKSGYGLYTWCMCIQHHITIVTIVAGQLKIPTHEAYFTMVCTKKNTKNCTPFRREEFRRSRDHRHVLRLDVVGSSVVHYTRMYPVYPQVRFKCEHQSLFTENLGS